MGRIADCLSLQQYLEGWIGQIKKDDDRVGDT